jgi:hypothetical protein
MDSILTIANNQAINNDQHSCINMGTTVIDSSCNIRLLVDKQKQMTDPNFIRHVIVVAGLLSAGYYLIVWRPKRN